MTFDHPLRRILARLCSAPTMTRLVDPTLADMRVEPDRPAWRGYLTLARVLALHGAGSLVLGTARVYREDDHAVPRAAAICAFTAILVATPVVLLPFIAGAYPGHVDAARAFVLLLPQGLILALPPSLLVAIPVAFGRGTARRRLLVRALGLALVCALATLMLLTRVMPDANQAFRVAASGDTGIARGPNEMTLGALRAQIVEMARTGGRERYARELEYAYHLRLALASMALPFGLLAATLAGSARRRTGMVLLGACAMACYLVVLPVLSGALTRWVATLPPALMAWMPTAAVVGLAGIVARRSTSVLQGGATTAG